MRYKILSVAAAIAIIVPASTSLCKITKGDLDKKVVVSEEAALLSQVDAVSLHLSSQRVAYAPRPLKSGVIEVEATVLDQKLIGNRKQLEEFVTRQINAFVSALQERLPIYAPSIAKGFNPDTDMVFKVNAGKERNPIADWSGGQWYWASTSYSSDDGRLQAKSAPQQSRGTKSSSLPPQVSKQQKYEGPSSSKEDDSVKKNSDASQSTDQSTEKKGCGCPARR